MTVGMDMAFCKGPERRPTRSRDHTIDLNDSAELKSTLWDMAVSQRGNENEADLQTHLEDGQTKPDDCIVPKG